MEFRILGPVEVTKDGQPLPLGPPKQRMLLAALLLRPNEVVSTDELIDALWGEHPPERAAKALQVYVWQLRKLLRREVLETRAPGYALVVSPDQLDLHRFESLLEEARLREPDKAAMVLREALGLFRGRPLADFAYERFAEAESARIDELRLQALDDRIAADLELGRHAELIGELESLVAGQPLRERLRAHLILALYRCGRQAEALAAYQDARRHLVEELGIEPGRELQALQAAILRHDPGLDLASTDTKDVSPDATTDAVAREPPREERKLVTVLAVGIGADTDEGADPELALAAAAPFHTEARREIESHGGIVERLTGDGLTGVFGAPVAHEDDPERAVRAALAIRSWVMDRRDRVWMGIDTGVALVSLAPATQGGHPTIAAGRVLGTAQRMQTAARVNGILVGAQTHRATRDVFEYREAGMVEEKGGSRELRAWEVLGERSRLRAEAARQPTAPLAGRRHELELLVSALARVRNECSPQLVTLVGVPGIGKSRLVLELHHASEKDHPSVSWRRGRCLPYGEGISLWALGEVVKSQAGILESDTPGEAREKLSAAVADVVEDTPDREWITNRLAPLVGAQLAEASTAAQRDESFAAWRRFLELLARDRPLVVVFEDLHWADDTLLDFVDELADRALATPLLILCTARPELLERRPGWGGGKQNSLTVTLEPLSDDETTAILAAVLDRPLDAPARRTLLARAEGNPLYTEQFARSQAEVGTLAELPDTIHGIIAARLDGLSATEKTLLQDAAVVGTVFWLGALESIGGVSTRDAEDVLHALGRKQFVQRVRRPTIAGETEYAFKHVLLRDVAYEQIPLAARAAKHRSAALWIERISEERVTDHAEILTHHYGRALELVQALGPPEDRDALEERYRRSLLLAGDRALQLDVARAEAYFGRALDLVPSHHPDRATVSARAAEVASLAGRYSEAEQRYETAIGELRAHGRTVELGGAMVSLSAVCAFRGETLHARELLDDAIGLLEREAPGTELARAYAQMARRHTLAERWEEAVSWSERALALAERLDMKEVSVLALQYRGNARSGLGDLGGLDDLREAVRAGLDHGLGAETARAYFNLAPVVWLAHGPVQGLELQQAGIEFGERRGVTGIVMLAKGQTLWPLFDLGRWNEAVDRADDVIAWDRQLGGSYAGAIALSSKALVRLLRGQLDEARPLAAESLTRGRRVEDPQILAPALAVSGMIEHALGESNIVVQLLEEFARVCPAATLEGGTFVQEIVRLCAATGALDVAEVLTEGRSEALARHRYGLLSARATMTEARGNLDEAARLYADAAEAWGEYGSVLEQAHALLGLGRSRIALGRSDAESPLVAARDLVTRLGAVPLSAETDALLAEVASATQ
jgi:predicted ATPase/DNA-binding SARP family transcriptional activator